ncbi:MAG TPA: CopD family protein [Mycobacterium sp.]|nr:CopD family protein [Mycobacterium sp.]
MTLAARRLAAGLLLVGALAWASAWVLADRQAAPAESAVRGIADVAAVAVLGLTVLPVLDEPRHRTELARSGAGPLTVAAVVWLIAEAVRLTVSAAQAADVGIPRLRLHTVAEFTTTLGGRAALLSMTAAALVCLLALVRAHAGGTRIAMAAAAAIGICARAVTGHAGDSILGATAVVAHILAAALWCGVLLALAVTVAYRGQWARVLPRFSRLALASVMVLLAAGIAGALVTVPSPAALLNSGYGRLLVAKVVVAAALVVLGWFNRTRWLPAACGHRIDAGQSLRRARREVALMVVALTLAAALAVAG